MSALKKIKLDSNITQKMVKTICVHSGSFHADESLAVYMLRLLPEYKDANVIRSRKAEDWEKSDIVVDVGATYDGIKHFDHHQRGFEETFNANYKTKLSGAGLIYKHFGKEIIKNAVKPTVVKDNDLEILYDKVYSNFIEAIDANDNGIKILDYEALNVKPKFRDSAVSLPGIVGGMNPSWNEDCTPAKFDENFFKASEFIGTIFVNLVKGYSNSWLPAKSLVRAAVSKRMDVDSTGEIIVLEQFCPWKEHLYEVEKEFDCEGKIKFVLFKDSSNTWRVSTVPVSSGSFAFRQGILEKLRGLRDEELSKESGVPDCVFVHAAGFIGGTQTQEGAYKLAKMSL
ncbi:hypothetical protein TBLA_0B08090 [Henningerozyma blattae CBS 6284]|uniref:Uncharacterized protein n=1 Tax=Henningerozyma blattae (strain ATCC 34711 / CBS 6284 / DSM 70876 / NBRC 10599 / NRRL Y-10934 / UCD 77-7) TaxID=1071380 RepID=I2GZS3_HENB6|nr:hypothetical protein TBLA_0B08090 [Tetrapisispora blattae CBS 6284]CCH59625.1 hypothetical protein TBLA_0B08090 [Tetrapisispora blattae CBS 6284]